MRALAMKNWPAGGFDFLLVSRRVYRRLVERPERNASIFGQILWMGFSQTSVAYVRGKRHAGRSKWTLGKKVKLAIDSVVGFSYAPIRLISVMGGLLATLGLLYAGLTVARRLLFADIITGWASLMCVILVMGGMQMLMLGVTGEYLWRALDEVRGRPAFLISEVSEPPLREDDLKSSSAPCPAPSAGAARQSP
jgi:dolichol-phosphate mannosyltransferase